MMKTFFGYFILFLFLPLCAFSEVKPKVSENEMTTSKMTVPLGQTHSLVRWAEIDPIDFLSLEKWKLDLGVKVQNPNWEHKYRQNVQIEPMGRILSCRGECFIFRGLNKNIVEFQSQVYEGDELHTGDDSVAWVFLLDGSLIRLSANSSVNLQEINFSLNESFIRLRLNQGHIFWNGRRADLLNEDFAPETDAHNLPLRILAANQEYFERELSKKVPESEDLIDLYSLNEMAVKRQFQEINKYRSEFQEKLQLKTRAMISTTNGTLNFENSQVDVSYFPGQDCYFKQREGDEIKLTLRGYNENSPTIVTTKNWQKILKNGRAVEDVNTSLPVLNILELLTKRIKSIELAREIWIQKYTLPITELLKEKEKLSSLHGLFLWSENDFEKRIRYLNFEIKRIETTHLKTTQNMSEKLDKNKNSLSDRLYHFSLNQYLLGLKKRFGIEKSQVKNMTDLQYYIWTLKNGKI